MNVALAAFVFAPALALGSFLNVVAARLPERRSLVRPASACPSCRQKLAWRDNVPVASYLLLRGRCRSCHAPIGVRYLAVELATAVLVAACFARFGFSGRAVVAGFFVSVLLVLSAIDAERRILPNRIVLPSFALVLVAQVALGASLFLFLAVVAYPAGMGMGDVKLALLLGAALGKTVSVALMLGMLAALILGVALLLRHGVAARKLAIPFGPFLALGSIIALFWGEPLLDAYLGTF